MSRRKQNSNPKRAVVALNSESQVRAFCNHEGLSLRVMNDGHHWVATDGKLFRVEWWPSTAKAVRGNSPDRFHHKLRVATAEQFVELVEQELEARVPPRPDKDAHKPQPRPDGPGMTVSDRKPTVPPRPDTTAHKPVVTYIAKSYKGGDSRQQCGEKLEPPVTVWPATKQTVTIEADRYAELLRAESRASRTRMFLWDALAIGGIVALVLAFAFLSFGYLQLVGLRRS